MIKNNFEGTIILFDTTSNLHKKILRFIEKKERGNHLSFIPFNTEIGQALIKKLKLTETQLSSVVLLENGQYYTQSTALLKLTRYLGRGWSVAKIFLILPKLIRDTIFTLFIKLF